MDLKGHVVRQVLKNNFLLYIKVFEVATFYSALSLEVLCSKWVYSNILPCNITRQMLAASWGEPARDIPACLLYISRLVLEKCCFVPEIII